MTKIALNIIIALMVFNGCKKEDDEEEYFELNYSDEASAVFVGDTIHFVLQQYGLSNFIKDSIPYSIENSNLLGDTIKMKMEVKFGSYSKTPYPNKQVTINKDTLYLWYASSSPPNLSLQKSSTILQVESQPKAAYYSVQSITIIKSANKYITFRSTNRGK